MSVADRTWQVLGSVIAVVGVGTCPVFLFGGLAVQLQQEFRFGAALLGVAAAGFFSVAALSSRAMGWVVERIGHRAGLRLAACASSLCLFGLAAADSTGWFLALLWLSGVPNSLGQPAANVLIVEGVPVHRRGLGFAVKQSAIPVATMLAGISVPLVALTIGWRWVFAFAGLLGLAAALTVPSIGQARRPAGGGRADGRNAGLPMLLLFAVGGGLGSAAANSLGAFVTTAAVDVGFSPGSAGLVLSLGSVFGLSTRLLSGIASDRWNPDLVRVITGMLVAGSLGYALLALEIPPLFLLGVVVGFGAGWAWPGLLNLAVARTAPDRVAGATSISQAGVFLGGGLGPLLFGLLAEFAGLPGAWLAASAAALLAAGLLLLVRR
ncbi:MFS transporter [Saccharopolyspora taberi]|uniref:Major facilitator superfamily (MFS) profile domain-containing protein n=1 Tax=Saccharopolyspora taberi TaxID=60895 RepID=A0ABN3VFW2_9PSEU